MAPFRRAYEKDPTSLAEWDSRRVESTADPADAVAAQSDAVVERVTLCPYVMVGTLASPNMMCQRESHCAAAISPAQLIGMSTPAWT
jgi:hypothetical protein